MPEQALIEAAADRGATNATATLTASTDHTVAVANASRDRLIISADVADVWVTYGTTAAALHTGVVVRAGGAPLIEPGWKGEVHCFSSGAAVIGIVEASYSVGDDQGERQPGADTFVPHGPSDTPIPPPTAPPPGTPFP